jgi:flagellar basal-body rod protein FlgB
MPTLDSIQAVLESAMRGAWTRQTVLTQNLANSETPGYQPLQLNFQAALREAVANGEPPETVNYAPEVELAQATPNGNGVSMEREAAQLAENGLDYETLSGLLNAHDETLRAAIGI